MTPENVKLLYGALGSTWYTLSQDMFGEGMPRSMSRAHVIEVVLDADYLEMYGYRRTDQKTKEVVAEFRKLSYDEQNKIAAGYFKHKRYGP